MICRVFCLLVSFFLLDTITRVTGLFKESAQAPCGRSEEFQVNKHLCFTVTIQVPRRTSPSIQWEFNKYLLNKGKGGVRKKWFYHNLLSTSFMLALSYRVLEWCIDHGKRQPANPLEVEEKRKTWSKRCVVFFFSLEYRMISQPITKCLTSSAPGSSLRVLKITQADGYCSVNNLEPNQCCQLDDSLI